MSKIHFDGPSELSPELLMAMWNALPEDSRKSLSQLFFAQYVRPLPDAVLASGAKAFFETQKVPKAAKEALQSAVAKKAVEIAQSMNMDQAKAILEQEFRVAGAMVAKERIGELVAAIENGELARASIPSIAETVGGLAKQYFLSTQQGQSRVMGLINQACEGAAGRLVDMVESKLNEAAKPLADRRVGDILRTAESSQLDTKGNNGSFVG